MVWTILVLQKPFDWAERCCLEIRRWNNCWRICRLVSSCIIIYACVFESVTTSMLMIILLRVNPRDIPFCKVGNGTYKIFTDFILIIIFGFIHSRWWRRVSIADFLSWLALLNISSKYIYCFCTIVSQLCILSSRPCVSFICDSELTSRVPWFGLLCGFRLPVVSSQRILNVVNYLQIIKKTLSPLSFSFCLFLVTCLWTRKFNKKEYIVKVLFFLDFDAFLRGSKKL